jgi:type III secretory pathway lipoprotein EscJ
VKVVVLAERLEKGKVQELEKRLRGIRGFKEISVGYVSTEIVFGGKEILEAVEIIRGEGYPIDRICEITSDQVSCHLSHY